MIAKKESYGLGAELVAHLIGPEFETPEDRQAPFVKWNEVRGKDPYSDPDEVAEGKMPEDLPDSVEV